MFAHQQDNNIQKAPRPSLQVSYTFLNHTLTYPHQAHSKPAFGPEPPAEGEAVGSHQPTTAAEQATVESL